MLKRSGYFVGGAMVIAACSSAQTPTPAVGATAGPGDYLRAERIASLPRDSRATWQAYLDQSARMQAADRAVIDAEVRTLGRSAMDTAPYIKTSFALRKDMTGGWFTTPEGRRFADNMLSFQTPSGGWSKHVDFSKGPRAPGMSYYSENNRWSFIATIDNNSTTEQMRFLARAFEATGEERYRASLLRGLDYLLAAQLPTGCWPQVFPLVGGYHDAATFNDDATVNVLRVLSDVGSGKSFPASMPRRSEAITAMIRGTRCLVESQVTVDGRKTIWAQQVEPITLAPVPARSYEHIGLASRESAGIMDYLMSMPGADPRTIEAVHAAADWMKANVKQGVAYDADRGIIERADAGPWWSRLSEIGTNRPIFSNRDGIILYDYRKLTDRATGYAWYVNEPADVLRKYETWAQTHPRKAP